MKKPKRGKVIMDDGEELPEEIEGQFNDKFFGEDFSGSSFLKLVEDDDVTEELTEDDFNQFKSDLPKSNDWEE